MNITAVLDTAKNDDPVRARYVYEVFQRNWNIYRRTLKFTRGPALKDMPAGWTVLLANINHRKNGQQLIENATLAIQTGGQPAIAHISTSFDGGVVMELSAESEQVAADVFAVFAKMLPIAKAAPKQLTMTFSTVDEDFTRVLTGTYWKDIKDNYAADVQTLLGEWMKGSKPPSQLILAHGNPGTGKTWAIRALACEWAKWANFIYIADVNAFFGGKSDYMMRLMFEAAEQSEQGKWNILVFEDMGHILTADAGDHVGDQGLARLLNCVDGFIGQELNLSVIITSNEEIEKVHPAIKRPGRGTVIKFDALDIPTAQKWAEKHGYTLPITKPMTLAELYHNRPAEEKGKRMGFK